MTKVVNKIYFVKYFNKIIFVNLGKLIIKALEEIFVKNR